MVFFAGSSALGGGRSAYFSQSASRSQILGRRYQPFANPFFDQASTYTPPNVKTLFSFCRFYHLTHGIINAIDTKAAEYPVTDLILQHRDSGVVKRWEELYHGVLNYRVFQFEVNLDYYVYGNAFVSPSFPFRKKLTCASCNKEHDAIATRQSWRYINHKFWLECSNCGQTGFAPARDDYRKSYTELGFIRWNPENVQIFHNEATGRLDYSLDLTSSFRSQIQMGRKDLVAATPQIFLDAVRMKRSLVFNPGSVFHLRRPSLSSMSQGWGIPLLMPVLKDAFYMQVMKKAQESVLLTHLVPQIFLFPQPATAGADPFTTVDLANWRDHIRRELSRQRVDPSYYGILPFPLGHQVIGENGKSLLLMPEIQQVAEQITVGMGFPTDLVFGSGTYAGNSVSMRMLENFFLSNVSAHMRLFQWGAKRFGAFLNWPVPIGRFKAFKMADDLQRQAFTFELNKAGKVSDTTLLSMTDLKVEDEAKLIETEASIIRGGIRQQQLVQAEAAGEAMLIQAKYQARAQEAQLKAQARLQSPPPDPFQQAQGAGLNQESGVSLDAMASALAKSVLQLPPEKRDFYMNQLKDQSPELSGMVQQMLPPPQMPAGDAQAQQQAAQSAPAGGVDMRPMPNVLPPRRPGGV